jgi:hypothetical protein
MNTTAESRKIYFCPKCKPDKQGNRRELLLEPVIKDGQKYGTKCHGCGYKLTREEKAHQDAGRGVGVGSVVKNTKSEAIVGTAKIIAKLVEAGHEDLANELLSLGENSKQIRADAWQSATDKWFDEIADGEADPSDPTIKRIFEIVKMGAPATRKKLDEVEALLHKVKSFKTGLVLKFIKDMKSGVYKTSYKHYDGGKVGSVSPSTMIGGFMDLLRQAMTYATENFSKA